MEASRGGAGGPAGGLAKDEATLRDAFKSQQDARKAAGGESKQPMPSASQAAMRTKPDCGEESYRGANKLQGKVALITGGDSGIGRAVAIAYAREGANVAVIYLHSKDDAEDTVALCRAAGVKATAIQADVAKRDNCVRAVEQCVRELGGLTTLVNNAAIQFPEGSHGTERGLDEACDNVEKVFAANFFSNIYLAAESVKHFNEDSGCTILFSTSVNAAKGHPDLISYTATKAAQVGLLRSLSKMFHGKLCRVNGVAPGPVWTPLIPGTWGEEKTQAFGEENPMGRAAQPAEMAPAYVFLASADSTFMDGQVLHLDGGMTTAS